MNRIVENEMFRSRPIGWTLASLFAIVAVGGIDYLTGPEIAFSPFYLIPVAAAAWLSGTAMAVVASAFAAAVWLGAEFASNRLLSNFVYAWNFCARFLFLLLVAVLLAQLREMLIRERRLSRTDPLTGLPNTRAFREVAEAEIERAIRYGQPLSLSFIDVDDFKRFNDSRGHAAGDRLLKQLGDVLRANLRASDLVARYGGDEYVVLLPSASQAEAEAAMTKVQDKLRAATHGKGLPVTVSIGAVTYEPGGPRITLDALMLTADRLMYDVKSSGKMGTRFATYSQ